jgi:hypothetical protein
VALTVSLTGWHARGFFFQKKTRRFEHFQKKYQDCSKHPQDGNVILTDYFADQDTEQRENLCNYTLVCCGSRFVTFFLMAQLRFRINRLSRFVTTHAQVQELKHKLDAVHNMGPADSLVLMYSYFFIF